MQSRSLPRHAFLIPLFRLLIIFCFVQKVPPKFFDPPPYNQPERPIPDEGQTIDVAQDVLIIEGNRLVIRARVVEGIPDPDVQWTLPDGSTLGVNERRGRFSVRDDGQLVVDNIQLDDGGTFTATATNEVGEDTAVSRVTVIREKRRSFCR